MIGNDNMLMAYAHVGHNAQVGSNVTIASYVDQRICIEDRGDRRLCWRSPVHPRRKMTMIGGMSRVAQDVPPFMLVQGEPLRPYGLNVVGLRRAGVTPEVRAQLKRAYRILYRSGLNLQQALERVAAEVPASEELDYLIQFLQQIRDGRYGRQLDRPR